MKIEVKNIKIAQHMSEETTAFTADVFVNGVKTAYAKNDGQGGSTFYHAYEGKRELLEKAEAHAKTLPSTTHTFAGSTITIDSDLEGMIDDAVDKKQREADTAKFNKKLEKEMLTGFVIGVPNSGNAYTRSFKGKPKLADLILITNGRIAVQNLYNTIKKELKDGEQILNTNLKALGLE